MLTQKTDNKQQKLSDTTKSLLGVVCSTCGEALKPWELPKDLDSIDLDEIECIPCEMKARDSADLDAGFI